MKHGTYSAYTQGCRCDDCRGAQRQYRRSHRAAQLDLLLIDVAPFGDWVDEASCRGQADTFEVPQFTTRKRGQDRTPEVVAAKRICFRCPVLEQCRTWIIGHFVDPCPAHVVAGMTKEERRIYRKEQGLAVPGRSAARGTAA